MTPSLPSAPLTWSGERVRHVGNGVLAGMLVLSILAMGAAIWLGATWAVLLPALAGVALVALVVLLRHPLLHLGVVLGLGVTVLSTEPGIQASEALYGLYYVGYLAGWFFLRIVVEPRPIAPHAVDKLVAIFLLGVAASVVPSLLWGASPAAWASEFAAMLLLAFYFPVREALAEQRHGPTMLLGVVALLVLAVSLRNVVNYRALVTSAILAEVIGGRRVDMNNAVLLLGLGIGLGLVASLRQRAAVLGVAGAFAVTVAAALVTQSRALWAVGLGMGGVAFLLASGPGKRRLAFGSVLLGVALFLGLLVLLGPKLPVIVQSFTRRFTTLGSAATRDISLLARYYEGAFVLREALHSPVLGHGMGVKYAQYEIIDQVTFKRSFVHNGYIALFYRFGVWGVGLVLAGWFGAIGRGIRALRASATPLARGLALGSVVMLVGALVYHNTSNLLHNMDGVLVLMLAWATASGLDARARGTAAFAHDP